MAQEQKFKKRLINDEKEFIGNNHRQYRNEPHQLKGLKQQEQERLQIQNRIDCTRNDVENQHLLNKQAFISQKKYATTPNI